MIKLWTEVKPKEINTDIGNILVKLRYNIFIKLKNYVFLNIIFDSPKRLHVSLLQF